MFQRNLLFNEIQLLQRNDELDFEEKKNTVANANIQAQSIFKRAGLKTTSVINKKTPMLIQTVLEQSSKLNPFIANKISQTSIPKNFFHYGSKAEFTGKYKKLYKIVIPFGSTEDKNFLNNVPGFYDRKTDSIHLVPSANLGLALTLAIYKLSSPGFGGFFGYQVSLGGAQYFANLVLLEQGLEPLKLKDIQAQLHCAEDLAGVVGVSMFGKAYFQDHSELLNHLLYKLSIGTVDINEVRNDALLKPQLLRTARFASHQAKNLVGVGITGAKSVRLWMRSEVPGEHEVRIRKGSSLVASTKIKIPGGKGDNTFAVNYPTSTADPNLEPLTKYTYQVIRTDKQILLGEGSFETSPAGDADTPEKVVIALISCHEPFSDRGTCTLASKRILRLLPRVLKENNVKFVLPCGDQIYADQPEKMSLFDNEYLIRQLFPGQKDFYKCSDDQIRSLYQMRYRTFWSVKPIRQMYENYPCYPTLDDHEIMDSWGTQPKHSEPKNLKIKRGAIDAYYDYQASSIFPQTRSSYHYDFSYGNIGIFVMDLRSERSSSSNEIFSAKQFSDLEQFLINNARKKALLIVCSVPVFFVPDDLADLGGKLAPDAILDHWSHSKNKSARDALLSVLHKHSQPKQCVAIVSGDVHIGNAVSVHIQGLPQPWLYQFTSSPISATEKEFTKWGIKAAPRTVTTSHSNYDFPCGKSGDLCSGRISRLAGIKGASRNPFVDMNIGLIEVQRSGDISKLKFKLIGAHPTEERPVTYFESNWLEGI